MSEEKYVPGKGLDRGANARLRARQVRCGRLCFIVWLSDCLFGRGVFPLPLRPMGAAQRQAEVEKKPEGLDAELPGKDRGWPC